MEIKRVYENECIQIWEKFVEGKLKAVVMISKHLKEPNGADSVIRESITNGAHLQAVRQFDLINDAAFKFWGGVNEAYINTCIKDAAVMIGE